MQASLTTCSEITWRAYPWHRLLDNLEVSDAVGRGVGGTIGMCIINEFPKLADAAGQWTIA